MRNLIILLSIVLLSCQSSQKQSSNPVKIMERDGVEIAFTDSEAGETTLVFIHGWGINQTYWEHQLAALSKEYRIVTLDLPGFGMSGKKRSVWNVEEYARDVSFLIGQLRLGNVILVGHSMSGAIVVETALQPAVPVIGVIGVDNMKNIDLNLTPEMEAEWAGYYQTMREQFEASVKNESQYLFTDATDTTIQNRVINDLLKSDPTIAVDCLQHLDKYPFAEMLKRLKQPLVLINSDYQTTDTLAFHKHEIPLDLLQIQNTGHYPMIEQPEIFNELLQEAIKLIKGHASIAD